MTDKYGTHDKEAKIVRAAFITKKQQERLTQEQLANHLGVTQGVIGRWVNGHKRIPDQQLMRLAIILDFDPLDVRPEVKDYVDLANSVLSKEGREDLSTLIRLLSESESKQVRTFLDFLLSQRQKPDKLK